MKQKQKFHYKVIGAISTAAFIMMMGVFTIDTSYLSGKLTLRENIAKSQPQTVEVAVDTVEPGELIEIQLLDNENQVTTLPENWEIRVSYFPQANVETTVITSAAGDIANDAELYTFSAPEKEALYKITLIDQDGQVVGVLGRIQVQSSIDKN